MEIKKKLIFDIEILRAIAVTLTVICHLTLLFPDSELFKHPYFLKFAYWVGVDIFFAVSGFVITSSLLPKLDKARDSHNYVKTTTYFYANRGFRLWPTAWVWLLVCFAASLFFNSTGVFGTVTSAFTDMIAAIFHVSNFHNYSCFVLKESVCGPYGIHWSLSLEEQIYFLLPVLYYVFRQKIVLLMILYFCVYFFIPHGPWTLGYAIRGDAFVLGFLIAFLHLKKSELLAELNPIFLKKFKISGQLILTFFIFAVCQVGTGTIGWFYMGVVSLISGVLVFLASFNEDYFTPKFKPLRKAMLWIGSRSYALYIIHLPIFFFMREFDALLVRKNILILNENNALFFITTILIMLVSVELNYRMIEQPMRNIGKRRFGALS